MQNTWQWRSLVALKTLSESKLVKLFKLPEFRVIMQDKPYYKSLRLENYVKVEYSKKRGNLLLLHADLSHQTASPNYMEWLWYSQARGGSAANYGPSFKISPQVVAQQHAFWVPLEQWCEFPDKWKSFKSDFTIAIRLDEDEVPIKVKRLWFKKYFAEFNRLRKEGLEL
jgi:hypothetical protein